MSYNIEKEIEILKTVVRNVTEEDRLNLPTVSHSRLELKDKCNFSYDLKYNQKKYTSESTLPLELGSLLHLCLEIKGKMLIENNIDYDKIQDILLNGYTETNEKTKEVILGLEALKKKYWEDYYTVDSEGRTYEQKLNIFKEVLHKSMEEDENWQPYLFEHPFEFVFNDRVIIKGFIDRISINKDGELQVCDYKTSKRIFANSDIVTSQQFSIYCMAILNEFKQLPIECKYEFILLDQVQYALTSGWAKRAIKKLNRILDSIKECEETGIWKPSPSPLCFWCSYSNTNPNAKEYKHDCEYYSLWEPNNKTFSVNKQFNPDEVKYDLNTSKLNNNTNNKERKLIF